MFFGLQPLKQNNAIDVGGRNYVPPCSVFQTPPAVPQKSPVSSATAETAAGARLQLSNEVKVANANGVNLGVNTQVTTILADAKRQFNEAKERGDLPAAQDAWNRAQRTFDAGNKLNYLEKGANGYLQNAATYLGVGYDKIQVKAPTTAGTPPVKPEPTPTAETNSVTGTQAPDALSNTPAAVDPQVAVDVQTIGSIGSKMANVQDKKQQLDLAVVAYRTAKPDKVNAAEKAFENAGSALKAAEEELRTSLADLSSRYDDGLIGTNYKDQKKLEEFKNNPALDKVVQNVAKLYKVPVSEVQGTHALAVLTGLASQGKNNPAAKELAGRLLAALQKPVAASQTRSSSDVTPPESESVPATETALA